MGIKLFGIDIAKIIKDEMANGLPEMILIKDTVGARTPGSLSAGQSKTPVNHTCNGFTETYKEDEIDGTTIKKGDHKIMIIGDTLDSGIVPAPGDRITTESQTFTIQEKGVERDPAAATYLCHSR